MNRYAIYCTPEQTRKALELGAPIEYAQVKDVPNTLEVNGILYRYPTAEQMIGWLEEQECIKEIFVSLQYINWSFGIITATKVINCCDSYPSRREATLTAIDSALEYLSNKK